MAKQIAQVKAAEARKWKTAEKACRKLKKDMEIARQVCLGEDRDAVQNEYPSSSAIESAPGSNDGTDSREEWSDLSSSTSAASGSGEANAADGFGASGGAAETRKRDTRDNAA